jgi:hypothetical protein
MVTGRHANWVIWLSIGVISSVSPVLAQDSSRPSSAVSPAPVSPAQARPLEAAEPAVQSLPLQIPPSLIAWSLDTPDSAQQISGRITGTVFDQSGAAVAGARVRLTRSAQSQALEVLTDDGGNFSLSNIAPGPFQLEISSQGLAPQTLSGNLHSGDIYTIPKITLAVASELTEMRVTPSTTEVAHDQVKEQEKQRALGLIPNFYVSYIPDAAPLSSKQKFELAWKMLIDPVNFGLTGAIAGVQQAQNNFAGYGQGAQGYAKRYGAVYADGTTGTLIGSAILPSLLKQDPRYFYKGTGSVRSRVLYAIASSVMCKGDNGHRQVNYSAILGGLAAGGISNLYYPASDRDGVSLTFENALIGIGTSAATNLLQEFLIRKLTPGISSRLASRPQSDIGEISTAPGGQEPDRLSVPAGTAASW